MKIAIPYGHGTVPLELNDAHIRAVLRGKESPLAGLSEKEINAPQESAVRAALAEPVGMPALSDAVKGRKHITIISSDHTRPVPSHITMPIILDEIRKSAPDAKITILIATGLHRATTKEELIDKYGEDIVRSEDIVIHDCTDAAHLRLIGTLPSGGKLELSTYALDADFLMAEGFIEPHFFAGFSGGRKSILPGVASYDCVVANHCAEFISDPRARSGNLADNPVHTDMVYAAQASGLAFILNVVIDAGHKIIGAFAGAPSAAHEKGCKVLRDMVSVPRITAPVVVTSNGGYPMDQNLYQMVKCMDTAEKCCDPGGVIIAVGECADGHGGTDFYENAKGYSPRELLSIFEKRSRDETLKDQWQSHILARIMSGRTVILVSSLPRSIVEDMRFMWAPTIHDAMEMAYGIVGSAAQTVAIPDGVGVFVEAHETGKVLNE
jgi:nickel-dependent lactate racemase